MRYRERCVSSSANRGAESQRKPSPRSLLLATAVLIHLFLFFRVFASSREKYWKYSFAG